MTVCLTGTPSPTRHTTTTALRLSVGHAFTYDDRLHPSFPEGPNPRGLFLPLRLPLTYQLYNCPRYNICNSELSCPSPPSSTNSSPTRIRRISSLSPGRPRGLQVPIRTLPSDPPAHFGGPLCESPTTDYHLCDVSYQPLWEGLHHPYFTVVGAMREYLRTSLKLRPSVVSGHGLVLILLQYCGKPMVFKIKVECRDGPSARGANYITAR